MSTGDISTWGHIKSVLFFSKNKGTRQKRFLYTQLRASKTDLDMFTAYGVVERLVPIDPSKLQPSIFPRSKEVHVTAGTGLGIWSKIQGWFWELGERLAEPDLRYSVKVGLAGGKLRM